MEVKTRRARLLHHVDENAQVVRGKTMVSRPKEQGLTVRGVLGEVNANSDVHREFSGKDNFSTNQIEKKIQKPVLRRNYCHVQSKIDTGLSAKPIQVSARPPLRREESTAGFAARAALLTRAAAKELIKKDCEGKENGKVSSKEIKKIDKVTANKELKDKKPVKDTAESFRKLKIGESLNISTRFNENTYLPDDIEDIDAGDNNPLLMSIYIKDIYRYLTHLEMIYPIEENYLKNQSIITGNMRATLIDWLVELQNQFSLLVETFQLAVGIIDRYLQAVSNVPKEKLQLIGVTAMFIASKYEEIYAPSIEDFAYITDNTYTKNDIIKCEKQIMIKLDFCLARPIPISFLRRFVKAAHGTSKNHHLAKYFVDLCLVDYSMAHYRPSELAAAAICLSLHLLSSAPLTEVWSPTLSYYSGYSFSHIEPIIRKISKIVFNIEKSKFQAVYQKYTSASLAKVSTLPQVKGTAIHNLIRSS
ncbi:G2/mitotic-specific cyclin-B2 [Pieris rapae]|uniref:G2/mitotic-specific cyclin-B2 n=1 Tax=Pieris rapae TaxID=64459 RepID=UPI001E280464|nr:G2/mitotic-specific cyclin-B2 [Pieris rapae]